MNEELIIACPHCEWQPDGKPYWICDKCPTTWDTFSTYGECPSCKYVHRETQCIQCDRISKHSKWYKNLEGPDVEKILAQEPIDNHLK